MTIKEAAEIIGCSRPTIYSLASRGLLTIERDSVLLRTPARIPLDQVVGVARQRGRDVDAILAKRAH